MVEFLAESFEWRDEGCELYPRCLECPLEKCVEEEPRLRQRLRMRLRAERMGALRAKGKSSAEIARMFNVSVRTVQRALKGVRVV